MKILVVYDSVFGNTEKVAHAIGEALQAGGEVEVARVSEVKVGQLEGVGLLVAGSPTRAFTSTKATKDFLRGIPAHALKGVKTAGFDTRADLSDVNSPFLNFMVKIFGYAAEPIAAALRRKGGTEAASPAGFFVQGTEGPLKEGELERAAVWAAAMLA